MRCLAISLLLLVGIVRSQSGELSLVIDHRMNGEVLRAGNVYAMSNDAWYFKPRFLKYYLAEITVIHDGGRRTPLSDLYVLVDALGQDRYSLGSPNVTSVEALEFHVGVDKLRNHLDPTIYPPDHPLALKNPTMHWGWAAGYRFLAVEGSSGTSKAVVSADVQVHSVGNELYRKISMPVTTVQSATGTEIHLRADYANLFTNLDVKFGLIFHGLGEETITMSNNMATRVFSSPTTSVRDRSASPSIVVWPTPTSSTLSLRTEGDVLSQAVLVDAWGSTCPLPVTQDASQAWDLSFVASGTYTLVATTTTGITHHVPVILLR